MFAAAGPQALARGERLAVLGELHAMTNLMGQSVFVKQCPCRDALLVQIAQVEQLPELIPVMVRNGKGQRTAYSIELDHDLHIEYADKVSSRPRAQTLRIADLVVQERAGLLEIARVADRRVWPLVQFIGPQLRSIGISRFKPFASQGYAPRLCIDRLVARRESWEFVASELSFVRLKNRVDRYLALRRWAVAHGFRRHLFYRLDLDSLILVELFADGARCRPRQPFRCPSCCQIRMNAGSAMRRDSATPPICGSRLVIERGTSERDAATGSNMNGAQFPVTSAVPGVTLIDEYSAHEVGSIAIQCPDHAHYHVHAESVLVEVLHEDGSPCRSGEIGRVVVTPLHEFRTPLLRYALGDCPELGAQCPCGRGLPVLTRVLGRVRNMITLPNGEKRWPLPGDGRYREIGPSEQYQSVQRTHQRFEVRLVTSRELTADEAMHFRARVQQCVGFACELDLVYQDTIARIGFWVMYPPACARHGARGGLFNRQTHRVESRANVRHAQPPTHPAARAAYGN